MRSTRRDAATGTWGQPQVVLLISGVSAVFGTLALLLPNREWKLVGFVAIGILLVVVLAVLARKAAAQDLHEKAPVH